MFDTPLSDANATTVFDIVQPQLQSVPTQDAQQTQHAQHAQEKQRQLEQLLAQQQVCLVVPISTSKPQTPLLSPNPYIYKTIYILTVMQL